MEVQTRTHIQMDSCVTAASSAENPMLVMAGLNFRTAPLAIRDKVAFDPQKLTTALRNSVNHPRLKETFILSTCNRTELYAVVERSDDWRALLCDLLARESAMPPDELNDNLYAYADAAAARQLFRVAAGLDSMVLGEAEIVNQIKKAAGAAREEGATGTILQRLVEKSLAASKQARTQVRYDECGLSVASVAVNVCKQAFPDLSQCAVMVVGAGETAELILHYLVNKGVQRAIIANRTLARAEQLARLTGGEAIGLDAIGARLHEADIIICCTGSPVPILTTEMLAPVMSARGERRMWVIDLAVPRDVEAEVRRLPGITLLNVDCLQGDAPSTETTRTEKVQVAEMIIESEVEDFTRWLSSRRAVAVIHELRQEIEKVRCRVTTCLAEELELSEDACKDVIDLYTQQLVRATLCEAIGAMKRFTGADDASYQMEVAHKVVDYFAKDDRSSPVGSGA